MFHDVQFIIIIVIHLVWEHCLVIVLFFVFVFGQSHQIPPHNGIPGHKYFQADLSFQELTQVS